MERKICEGGELKILGADSGPGSIRGYASTWSNWDRVKERPVKGAFAPHLEVFKRDGFISLGHDWSSLPIATVLKAQEDDIGLYLEAEFHSTPLAQEARTIAQERLERGKTVAFSIGYEIPEGGDEYVEEGRLLKEIKLYEVSLVNVPANPLALVTGAKGGPLAGLTMEAHSEAVLAAVREYADRTKGLSDLRAKEGRVLSGANREQIKRIRLALIEELVPILDGLLALSEPKASPDDVRKAIADWLFLETRIQGVKI